MTHILFWEDKNIIFFFLYEVSPRPYSYSVPRSLNDWPTKVVVEPSERIYCLPGPND
jgi:hypothetical protein